MKQVKPEYDKEIVMQSKIYFLRCQVKWQRMECIRIHDRPIKSISFCN